MFHVQIFFPIYYANHFYVICFNLKNIAVEIIDNRIGEDIDSVYDGIPQCLVCNFPYLQCRLDLFYFMLLTNRTNIIYQQDNLCWYIAEQSPKKSKILRNAPILRLQMKWRTKKRNVDSGVFAMNHMETYMGKGIRNWECKFAVEEVNKNK